LTPVLEIEGLAKSFRSPLRRKTVHAIVDLNLAVEAGSAVAFVGPNGAGKTTTLFAVLGFLKPDRGSIRVFGEPAGSLGARKRIGFQSEIFHTYPFYTARRALSFYGRLSGLSLPQNAKRIERELERLGLAQAADRKVGTFSKGMTQRLGLAQALLHDPDLLLLDEPTTGLDPEGRKLVGDLILEEKARGKTIFLSSHSEVWEVEILAAEKGKIELLAAEGLVPRESRDGAAIFRGSASEKNELLRRAAELGLEVSGVRCRSHSLEDLYMERLGGASDG
jgi:ABC-2 type transport system ATP-binding protein